MSSIEAAKTSEDIKKLMLSAKKFVIEPELTQVELAPLVWTDDCFSLFISAISKHHTLKALYLTGAKVSSAQYYALFEALKCHPSLKRLFMGKFLPCDEDNQLVIERFSKYVQCNSTIRVLDLSSNYFEDAYSSTMHDIAKIIEFNCSLKTLHLSAVSMRDAGMKLIARAMKKNTTLLELNLSFNINVEEDGYKELFAALEENTTLLKLDVTDLPITAVIVDSLCRYLRRTKTLLCLRGNFSERSIQKTSVRDIASDLNRKLTDAFFKNTSLLNCQLSVLKRNADSNNHLMENYAAARNQRNSIIIACITFARRLDDMLNIFPMEIWLNIFRFVTMWSRRYLRTRSSSIFTFICDNIGTINTYLANQTTFRIVQQQKRNYVIKTYK